MDKLFLLSVVLVNFAAAVRLARTNSPKRAIVRLFLLSASFNLLYLGFLLYGWSRLMFYMGK
jgi:hypothetical protein